MAKRKKNHPPGKEILAPGIEQIVIGKGFTKRSTTLVDINIASLRDAYKYWPSHPLFEEHTFEGRISATERESKIILSKANLQRFLPGKWSSRKEDEISFAKNREKKQVAKNFEYPLGAFGGVLIGLHQNHGIRERIDSEWYAAAILYSIALTRASIRKGDAVFTARCAVELGTLITEAKALGFFKEAGKEGGKRERWTLPVSDLIRSLIRKNRQGTVADLWNMIPTDSIDGIRIQGCRFYRNGGRLLALGKVDGCKDWRPVGKPLQFPAFEKRVGQTRKLPTR